MYTQYCMTVTEDCEVDYFKDEEVMNNELERLIETIMDTMGYTYEEALEYANYLNSKSLAFYKQQKKNVSFMKLKFSVCVVVWLSAAIANSAIGYIVAALISVYIMALKQRRNE